MTDRHYPIAVVRDTGDLTSFLQNYMTKDVVAIAAGSGVGAVAGHVFGKHAIIGAVVGGLIGHLYQNTKENQAVLNSR
jgi:hypothetical protein